MIAATQRISQDNLHQRLALGGPRDELRELGDTIDGLLAAARTMPLHDAVVFPAIAAAPVLRKGWPGR